MEQRKNYANSETIKTIYLGGGTPSLLSVDQLEYVFNGVLKTFSVDNYPETTIEMNPEDVTGDYLKLLKSFPVNRVSLGIQSFFDDDLKYLGRIHDAAKSLNAVNLLKDYGYDNISADLIYGVPTLTGKHWLKNLEILAGNQIRHISAYALTIEEKTLLEHQIRTNKTGTPDENFFLDHFKILKNFAMEHGYIHYEISNFGQEGFFSRHNTAYWHGEKYIGIGPSAHSYNGKSRRWNVGNINDYIDSVTFGSVKHEKEDLSDVQLYNEYIMTRLRTMWGCDIDKIKSDFGQEFADFFFRSSRIFINDGRMKVKNQIYFLTESGMLLADRIIVGLMKES